MVIPSGAPSGDSAQPQANEDGYQNAGVTTIPQQPMSTAPPPIQKSPSNSSNQGGLLDF